MQHLMKLLRNDNGILKETKRTTTRISTKAKKRNDKNEYEFPSPKNDTHYTLSETILNIQQSKLTINQFYSAATKKQPPIIIYALATL